MPAWITETDHRMRKMNRKQGKALNRNSWAETSQDINSFHLNFVLIRRGERSDSHCHSMWANHQTEWKKSWPSWSLWGSSSLRRKQLILINYIHQKHFNKKMYSSSSAVCKLLPHHPSILLSNQLLMPGSKHLFKATIACLQGMLALMPVVPTCQDD